MEGTGELFSGLRSRWKEPVNYSKFQEWTEGTSEISHKDKVMKSSFFYSQKLKMRWQIFITNKNGYIGNVNNKSDCLQDGGHRMYSINPSDTK